MFTLASDSPPTGTDTITDFTHAEDKIDFSALGPLDFIGNHPFTAADQVRVIASGGHSLIEVNTEGQGGPEMTIVLSSVVLVTESDFFL